MLLCFASQTRINLKTNLVKRNTENTCKYTLHCSILPYARLLLSMYWKNEKQIKEYGLQWIQNINRINAYRNYTYTLKGQYTTLINWLPDKWP